MEKMSRMSKYKDLREGIKTDVVSDKPTTAYTTKEEPVRDADYYKRFLANEEAALGQSAQLKNAMNDDTLVEPMTFDTINSQVDEELERALSRVRQESGQEDFNTRMDILNKIRQSKMIQDSEDDQTYDDEDENTEEPEEQDDQEDDDDDQEETRHRFGFFKRHQDDEDDDFDEDDDEEDDDEEDDDEDEEPKKGFGMFKRHKEDDEENDDLDDEDDDDDDNEDNSVFVKILNVIIIILGLVLIALLGYIAKEYFL